MSPRVTSRAHNARLSAPHKCSSDKFACCPGATMPRSTEVHFLFSHRFFFYLLTVAMVNSLEKAADMEAGHAGYMYPATQASLSCSTATTVVGQLSPRSTDSSTKSSNPAAKSPCKQATPVHVANLNSKRRSIVKVPLLLLSAFGRHFVQRLLG